MVYPARMLSKHLNYLKSFKYHSTKRFSWARLKYLNYLKYRRLYFKYSIICQIFEIAGENTSFVVLLLSRSLVMLSGIFNVFIPEEKLRSARPIGMTVREHRLANIPRYLRCIFALFSYIPSVSSCPSSLQEKCHIPAR